MYAFTILQMISSMYRPFMLVECGVHCSADFIVHILFYLYFVIWFDIIAVVIARLYLSEITKYSINQSTN